MSALLLILLWRTVNKRCHEHEWFLIPTEKFISAGSLGPQKKLTAKFYPWTNVVIPEFYTVSLIQ